MGCLLAHSISAKIMSDLAGHMCRSASLCRILVIRTKVGAHPAHSLLSASYISTAYRTYIHYDILATPFRHLHFVYLLLELEGPGAVPLPLGP